ncbi:MAG TPA: aspartate--tRNA(Asn) ligase [Candidatus Paceibacterota bacterium]|nr:aspartate--tRNA(Asn) ligase [Candidatus Paceibacterota bacterium]
MTRTLIGELAAHIGEAVSIEGSVDVARNQGKMAFFDFRDRTGTVQGVVFGKPDVLAIAQALRQEWVVRIAGVVNERPEKMRRDVPNGSIELEITAIEVLAEADAMPFDTDAELNIDTMMDNRPLTLRRPRERAIFRIQAEIVRAYRDFLNGEGFTEFQAPKFVGDDAEGGGNVFRVEYFKDKSAYLATSPQLYKQIMVGVFERVFAVGNVFRAEKHATTRHLNEYTSLDIEMGFIEDHTTVMALEERFMRFLAERLRERCAADFAALGAEIPRFADSEIPRLKLREAQALISKETGVDCTAEPDLEPEHERWLCEWAKKEHGSDFVFITHYPVSKRPFYTYEDEADPGFTKSFDLLFRGVEITTGGQREHRYDELIRKLEAKGLKPENFQFYLMAFKYGMPPHGGWGMGLERLTQKLIGLDNVKEATLFPRDMNRIDVLLSTADVPAESGETD